MYDQPLVERMGMDQFLQATSTPLAVTADKVDFGGWPNCYRLSNGDIEAIITADVGPRVIRYAFRGGPNFFSEMRESFGKSGESRWQLRGGHRLWVAPETAEDESPITYAADNHAVDIKVTGSTVVATPPLEKEVGIQKQMEMTMSPSGGLTVTHRITNQGSLDRELSPWVLTMMAQGGVGFFGLPPRGTHPEVLAPTNPLIIWAFTHLNDPRWLFLKKYVGLRQDPRHPSPQKIGSRSNGVWGAYALHGGLFLKHATASLDGEYPDLGSAFEMFANGDFLELETLGPLQRLKPGQTATHVENWSLHREVKIDRWDDETLDSCIQPVLTSAGL